MGREIRKVPKNWQHPKDRRGRYIPLHAEDSETECQEWWAEAIKWHNNPPKDRPKWYWQWAGNPPNPDHYVDYEGQPTDHYQIYETVSEGTPCSPVFETLDDMVMWMTQPIDWSSEYNFGCAAWQSSQGKTKEAAEAFAKNQWAPSMVLDQNGMRGGIDASEDL